MPQVNRLGETRHGVYLELNGAWYGRPKATPATIVCAGLRCTAPVRLLFRVSTNSIGPLTTSSTLTSAGAPACSVPSFGMRLTTLAGFTVVIAITCSSVNPMFRNLLITHV